MTRGKFKNTKVHTYEEHTTIDRELTKDIPLRLAGIILVSHAGRKRVYSQKKNTSEPRRMNLERSDGRTIILNPKFLSHQRKSLKIVKKIKRRAASGMTIKTGQNQFERMTKGRTG